MLVTLTKNADSKRIQSELQGLGLWTKKLEGRDGPAALVVDPCSASVSVDRIATVEGVADVCSAPSATPLLDRARGRAVTIAGRHGMTCRIGGDAAPILMAGPCSVESAEQIMLAAKAASAAGATLLRGGAFKPRTSPYSFSGHGRAALGWMREAADTYGLGVVTEVMSETEVEAVAGIADLLQVGSRNMQNFALLRAVGASGKPVLLKRGMAATVDEWLLAAEHLLAAGASGVVFCERGIIGFDPSTRNLLDLGAVALVNHVHRLPVIVDPSHAAGRRDLVIALSRAALAAGASGLLVEAHPDPNAAKSDGAQSLEPDQLHQLGEIVRGAV
jgi:3-deoxy-7-phosphoheptulonate synthase